MTKAVSYAPGFVERRSLRPKKLSPHPQLTDQELAFLRNEIRASLDCGADDPLFEVVYQKLKVAETVRVLRLRSDANAVPRKGVDHG